MNNLRKNLSYYLGLPWEIKLKKIPESYGGGWEASIPLLGEGRCHGEGKTKIEALKHLDSVLKEMLEDYLERGYEIPEPKEEEEEAEEYSGRILLRIPHSLHFLLAKQAKKNGMSLNSYLVHLLSLNYPIDQVERELKSIKESFSLSFKQEITPEFLQVIQKGLKNLGEKSFRKPAKLGEKLHPKIKNMQCNGSNYSGLRVIKGEKGEKGEETKVA